MKNKLSEIGKAILFINKMDKMVLMIILIQAILNSFQPYIFLVGIAAVIDSVTMNKLDNISYVIIGIIVLQMLVNLLRFVINRIYQYKCEKVDEKIKLNLHKNILDIPFDIFNKKETQESIKKAENSFMYTGGYTPLLNYLLSIIQSIISLIVGFGIMLSLCEKIRKCMENTRGGRDISIVIITFVFVLLLGYYIIYKMNKMLSEKSEQQLSMIMEDEGKLSYYLFKVFNDYEKGKSIRLHFMQKLIMNKYYEVFNSSMAKNKELLKVNGKMNYLTSFITMIMNCMLYAFIIYFSLIGCISIGQITVFIGGMNEINIAITHIIQVNRMMQRQINQLNKYMSIEKLIKKEDAEICCNWLQNNHTIQFLDVGYKYENSEYWALRHFNYTFTFDRTLSIVGENGAGKTTLIKLLLGLYKPTEGKILLDNCELKKVNEKSYRNLFNVIFQDFNLYAFSIKDNIVAGKEKNDDMIREVLKKVNLYERVQKLPEKEGTPLFSYDENGINMSGGELQRLAIARGLYKNAPMWIMDEPTCALDPISEAEIFDNLKNILGNKPCIFISHRLSSCQMSDNILVLSNGKIEEQGTHKELLKKSGLYATMWEKQAKYFKEG